MFAVTDEPLSLYFSVRFIYKLLIPALKIGGCVLFFSSQCFMASTFLATDDHCSAVKYRSEAVPCAIATTNTAVAMEDVLCFNTAIHITTSLSRTNLHSSGYVAKAPRPPATLSQPRRGHRGQGEPEEPLSRSSPMGAFWGHYKNCNICLFCKLTWLYSNSSDIRAGVPQREF